MSNTKHLEDLHRLVRSQLLIDILFWTLPLEAKSITEYGA